MFRILFFSSTFKLFFIKTKKKINTDRSHCLFIIFDKTLHNIIFFIFSHFSNGKWPKGILNWYSLITQIPNYKEHIVLKYILNFRYLLLLAPFKGKKYHKARYA